ncbi:MAG: sigma 54-interacting transcriptional regulator [Oligoflexia bacterium]|nr:sigma 54-interacting transcriptional regulator [Oligoflexia bacterium]
MSGTKKYEGIVCAVIGSPDFCRRISAVVTAPGSHAQAVSAAVADAWSVVVTARPNLIFTEIGLQHSERQHALLRKFLEQLRERQGNAVHVAAVLAAPEKFAFGGDLLFANELDLKPSCYINTFLAVPPGLMPSVPGLLEQVSNVLDLFQHELRRQAEGKPALPALGAAGWITSLADPQSRELWNHWLPRYASYTNENPIIIGETGTGKTNLAHALHILSGRKGEFVAITPRDFSSSELVQAELFGAVAGAYTGAVDKWGLVKRAEKGTLFIDELQSIDKDLQGKLITFIENKAYRRVGSSESVSADVRFVFASNRTLYDMMSTQTLRDDFAYRLERVQLDLPPLNMRRLDIVAALAYALAKIQRQRPQALPAYGMTSAAYRMLFCQRWPGNLRQLENTAAQLCEHTDINGTNLITETIVAKVLGSRLSGEVSTASEVIAQAALRLGAAALAGEIEALEGGRARFEALVRSVALEATGGDIEKASTMINDSPQLMEINARAISAQREITPLQE